jgi:hypothetical protein
LGVHYISQPELIAVVGHPLPGGVAAAGSQQREIDRANVARIARRVRSLLLPAVVMRFWTDENGWLMDVVELNLRGDERSSTSIAPEASEPVA